MSILDKITPGPWQLTTMPFELLNTDSAATIYGPPSIQGGACLIADISRSAGEAAASENAKIIVAAPEMLSIIERVANIVDHNEEDNQLRTDAIKLINKLNEELT